jgi:DNA-binding SARP family transcriptional activator/tetratricopeptide (TPR) repeat protein
MRCRLSLFGPPRLLDDQGRLISVPAKTYALVAYLVLTSGGGPVGRALLRRFLWIDSDSKTAAANLRKFLSRIVDRQKACGFELIRSRRDHVELSPLAQIDLAEFLQIASSQPFAEDLVRLCDIYRGELLDGFELESGDISAWLDVERTKLRDAFIAAVVNRLEPMASDVDRVPLRIAARRLIEVDPYNEVAHRTLMRLFAEDHEPARARDIYTNLKRRLAEDLGVEPDPATQELLQSLLPSRTPKVHATPRHPPSRANPMTDAKADDHKLAGEADALPRKVPIPSRSGLPKLTILPPPPVAGQDYRHQIAISLIEDITIGICRHRALSVVAPHTAAQLSLGGKKALLKTFGIDYAVETQLLNRGGDFWLSVKVIEADSREILWSDHFAFDLEPAAQHYRDLSVRILTSVVEKIERAELKRYENAPDASAYHLYLGGQRHLRTFDLPSVRRARRAFKSAVSDCPDFVPALSGLAKTYHLEWLLLARGENELLGEAERLARLSLEIDPDDARGYRELGVCNLYTGRFDESLEAFSLAESRNPRFADLLMDYSDALTHACQPAAGLEKIKAAIELNPLCPDSYWWASGGANFYLEHYAEAINSVSRMRDQSPAYRLLAASWAMLGDRELASEYVRKTKEIHPEFRVSDWLSILPIRDKNYKKRYEHSLRQAGFD